MKKIIASLPLFLFSFLMGQNEVTKDQLIQIKSRLEVNRKVIEDSIAYIDKEITKKETDEFNAKYSDSTELTTKAKSFDMISDEPFSYSKVIGKIFRGDDIKVLDYDSEKKIFYIKFKDLKGFVGYFNVELTDDINKLVEKRNQEYELIKLEKKKFEEITIEERKKQQLHEEELKTQFIEQQRKQQALEKEEREKQRRQQIFEKFGNEVAEKIIAHKIWLGMTKEMARESLGEPTDINRTVTAYSIHEQWVYTYHYLYFDDGILTSWQD